MADLRVLLVGHAISPLGGSEPGLTWNWAWELSRFAEVTVLAHPQYRQEVEERLKEEPRFRVVWIEVPLDPWYPPRGEREVTVKALAEAITRLALSPELRKDLGLGAWRWAQEERWDRRAERMLALYEEVLGGRGEDRYPGL